VPSLLLEAFHPGEQQQRHTRQVGMNQCLPR
jgi:hypothetical protein